jgi:glycosyltransferase involved in cell wall biosynthesis
MRIAQIAPLAEAVPPRLYGGTERVVSWLTEELVEMGHEVTLFASGDSVTNATLEPCSPRALRLDRGHPDPMLAYAAMLARVAERAGEFDVVHAHTDWIHIPLLRCLKVPFLSTLHGRLDHPLLQHCSERFIGAPFVSISDAQRLPLPGAHWVGTVHHGLPSNLLAANFAPQGYLAFIGRIAPDKGPETAIHLARAAGLPLKIAAKIGRADRSYFTQRIKPLIDGSEVEFAGEIDDRHKAEFLGNAAALLFPICWPEPFGLVMIEAMACGTPVIAFPCGSVSEVVEDGVTGFVVEPDAGLSAIHRIGSLDRRRVRARFEQRFTARRMAEDYVHIYEKVIDAAEELSIEAHASPALIGLTEGRFADPLGVSPIRLYPPASNPDL